MSPRASRAAAAIGTVVLALLVARAAWAADGGAAGDAGIAALRPRIPTRRPSPRASTRRGARRRSDPRQHRRPSRRRACRSTCRAPSISGPFSLLGRDETTEQNLGDGRIRREFVIKVAAYEPGPVELPAIDVTYLGPRGEVKSVRTAPIAIKIASLIANEPEPALKDAATTVSVMEENRMPLYIGGASAGGGAWAR